MPPVQASSLHYEVVIVVQAASPKTSEGPGHFRWYSGGGAWRTPTAAAHSGRVRKSKLALVLIGLSFRSLAQRAAADRSIQTPTSVWQVNNATRRGNERRSADTDSTPRGDRRASDQYG